MEKPYIQEKVGGLEEQYHQLPVSMASQAGHSQAVELSRLHVH